MSRVVACARADKRLQDSAALMRASITGLPDHCESYLLDFLGSSKIANVSIDGEDLIKGAGLFVADGSHGCCGCSDLMLY